MSTTDPSLATTVLSCLEASEVSFAVLHGEPGIASNAVTSDVDLVVGDDPVRILNMAHSSLRGAGVHPVLFWPYDVGDAVTVFFASEDGWGGAQFDLLHDPGAIGQDGLRTEVALNGAYVGDRWPRVSPMHELLYLIRKRHRKGDIPRLRELLAEATAIDESTLNAELANLFPRNVGVQLRSMIVSAGISASPPRRPALYRPRNVMRKLRRLRSPIGFWATTDTKEAAEALESRFGALLPHVASGQRPDGRIESLRWYARLVMPVTYRPGLFISWPDKSGWPRPDGFVGEGDGEVLYCRLARVMEDKLVRTQLSR